MKHHQRHCIILGGGAAGFFAALITKANQPKMKVTLIEKGKQLLTKVKISGGGRCNVTHSCFEPKELIKNYPRGFRELLGPFTKFQPKDTIKWFENRGVKLKTEKDGRMFPHTNSSETIIQCLTDEAKKLNIHIATQCNIRSIQKNDEHFELTLADGTIYYCDDLILATGSSRQGHQYASSLGHTIVEPVPSLFTFNIPNSPLNELSGVSVQDVEVTVPQFKKAQRGPILITHWGFSGPAVLKLSSWLARDLYHVKYDTEVLINWIPDQNEESLYQSRKKIPHRKVLSENPFSLPKKLWGKLIDKAGVKQDLNWSEMSNEKIKVLIAVLKRDSYQMNGKSTHKEEFVTAGGVELSEVDFRTMGSRCCRNLYFVGEILNIDGVTGGFNFQNAWTTGWLAGKDIANV